MIELLSESAILRTIKNNKSDKRRNSDYTRLYVFEAVEIALKVQRKLLLILLREQINLMKSIDHLCKYEEIPDIIDLKKRIANRVIAENSYFF